MDFQQHHGATSAGAHTAPPHPDPYGYGYGYGHSGYGPADDGIALGPVPDPTHRYYGVHDNSKPLPPLAGDSGIGVGVADDDDERAAHSGSRVPLTGGGGHERRRRRHKSRWRRFKWRKVPYFVWTASLIQVAVFVAELAKMGQLTGSPIQTKPSFNPMIGPSSYVMINMGARFTPCMHAIDGVTDVPDLKFPCPNSTDTASDVCALGELCGMGMHADSAGPPKQWWRFITPIFLHAGFVHIGFNLLLQLTLGADLERAIGIVRFFIVYFASGIAGFLLGGNFTPDGITSTGASGALFGVIALDLLDLLFNWQLYLNPVRNLLLHIAEIIVSFVIGLLPGLDNFSHIGGFAMGLLTGTALLRSPIKLRVQDATELTQIGPPEQPDKPDSKGRSKKHRVRVAKFKWRQPQEHFQNRSRWWYGWLVVRVAAIVLAVVYFVTLAKNFSRGGGNCSWCKYLSCLPVHGWCDQGKITTTTTSN
ncbi:hypothetical protein TRICI_002995 [Trichomonascus ciferrii]|uniref:Rhomboid-type serine protease n=1 Tax=Trichomonascus ciferrii TaxID=44093 RepID=A0A642V594_9ASCO|nr:hypothetical protein TRICI_002995 [Trichomonascus ciferrii]